MINGSLEKMLRRADYISLHYKIRFDEDFILPAYALLRLRRELSRVLKHNLDGDWSRSDLKNLLQPVLPTDPVLLRRIQQPAPGFILRVDSLQPQKYVAGDLLVLNVCFFCQGMLLVEPFTRLLEALGPVGLCRKTGRFHLESIAESSDQSVDRELWSGGVFSIAPTISDLCQHLEPFSRSSVKFEFMTPARLLKKSRPLFRSGFDEIFPFVLRRVTGMLAAWADLEEVFDVDQLLKCAAALVESDNRLHWQDWRPLQSHEEAGGLSGSVTLVGSELAELWPLLAIGGLFGIGKGAAFGAGRYRLI